MALDPGRNDTNYRTRLTDSDTLRDNEHFLGEGLNTAPVVSERAAKVVSTGDNVRYLSGSFTASGAIAADELIAQLPSAYYAHELTKTAVLVDTAGIFSSLAVSLLEGDVRALEAITSGAVISFDNVVYFSE